jgi:hypothetical protein
LVENAIYGIKRYGIVTRKENFDDEVIGIGAGL